MRIIFYLACMCLLTPATLIAQQSVGIGTTTPNPNAALDIKSTTKGVLIPSLTAAQQTTLAGMLTPTEAGMLVTDAVTGRLVRWTGSAFQIIETQPGHEPTAAAPLKIAANNFSLNPGTAVGDLLTWDGNNWVNMQSPNHFTDVVDNRQPWLAMNYCIALYGVFPSQSQPYVGEINIMGLDFVPVGWASCNGQLLSIAEYETLYTLLGTTYGGDGVQTFGVPDMRGRIPLHQGTNAGVTNVLGQLFGTEEKTFHH